MGGTPALSVTGASPPAPVTATGSSLGRLSDELEAMASLLRLAADPEDPEARRRVRATLETALLLRPLLARREDGVVVERLRQQIHTAQALIDYRPEPARAATQPAASGLAQALPLLLPLLKGQPPSQPGPTTKPSATTPGPARTSPTPAPAASTSPTAPSGSGPATGGVFSRLLPLVTNPTMLNNLAGLIASLNALRAQTGTPAEPSRGSTPPPSFSSPPSSSSSSSPGSPPASPGGAFPAAVSQLVPAAAALLSDPNSLGQLLQQAEQRLGPERLQHLYQLAQGLAGGNAPPPATTTASEGAAS